MSDQDGKSLGKYRYPCTAQIGHAGFGDYLENNLGATRSNIRRFSQELGDLLGSNYISLTNSGSSANLAAALALAECSGSGTHAITAGFTFPTTMSSLLTAGFKITAVDTEPHGFCIDPTAVRKAIRKNTKVLCVTHFLGFSADLIQLRKIADEFGLLILQDACETLDLKIDESPIHSMGTLTSLSFYHPHHLSSYGGGAVISPDIKWFQIVESLTHWGRTCSCHYDPNHCQAPPGMDHNFWYVRYGYNLEMSELNACYGRFQLLSWAPQEAQRKKNYDLLYDMLKNCNNLRVYSRVKGSTSPFVFPITSLFEPMPQLAKRIMKRGIEVRSLMGGAITNQPAYQNIDHDGLVNCLEVGNASFFVGIHQTLSAEDVLTVGRIILEEAQ